MQMRTDAEAPSTRNLIVNRDKPPFDNPDLRRAMALSIDRKAFIDILGEGQGDIGGVLQPAPGGLWGMPPDLLNQLPGYDPDVQKNRTQARDIMKKLGVRARQEAQDQGFDPRRSALPGFRGDPDRPIEAGLYRRRTRAGRDAELFFPKILRKDFTVALNLRPGRPRSRTSCDLFYGCGSSLNWDGYCNPEVDKLIERQSDRGRPGSAKRSCGRSSTSSPRTSSARSSYYLRGGTCCGRMSKG